MMDTFIDDLRSRGLHMFADTMADARLVPFADWRWKTLGSITRCMRDWVASFLQHFNPLPFNKSKLQELGNLI